MPETGQEDHPNAVQLQHHPGGDEPETALSISIIIATLLASVVTIMMLFARLAPSQRRDLIRLVRQLHRSRPDS